MIDEVAEDLIRGNLQVPCGNTGRLQGGSHTFGESPCGDRWSGGPPVAEQLYWGNRNAVPHRRLYGHLQALDRTAELGSERRTLSVGRPMLLVFVGAPIRVNYAWYLIILLLLRGFVMQC
jgi:hypothetical protein